MKLAVLGKSKQFYMPGRQGPVKTCWEMRLKNQMWGECNRSSEDLGLVPGNEEQHSNF